MPKKKTEETVEETTTEVTETEEVAEETVEASDANAEENAAVEAAPEAEEKPKKGKKKETKAAEEAFVADSKVEAVSADTKKKSGKRAERIGIVQSDKMTKTVTVRVDRVVKHPVYRKYVKRRKNFMAHDEKGAGIGDKVRIIETRPMSARKRWRVVEIIQKAEK